MVKPAGRFGILLVAIVLSSVVLAACGGDESTSRTRVRNYNFAIVERDIPSIASNDILVTRDNNLSIVLTADEDGTFIISQFNVEQDIGPNTPATVTFEANAIGTFPMIFRAASDGSETEVLGIKVINQEKGQAKGWQVVVLAPFQRAQVVTFNLPAPVFFDVA